MSHYSKQKGLSAVLILIVAVAAIIGGAFLAKKMGAGDTIKDIQDLVKPEERRNIFTGEKVEEVAIVSEPPVSPRTANPVIRQTRRSLSNHYVSEPPAQTYYDQTATYSVPPTYIVPVKKEKKVVVKKPVEQPVWKRYKYLPERVRKQNRQARIRQKQTIKKDKQVLFKGFGYDVQLLSTRNEAAANDIKNKIRMDGYAGFIEPVWRGRERMFRVKIGHYRYRHEADEVRNSIHRRYRQYAGAIVVSTDK